MQTYLGLQVSNGTDTRFLARPEGMPIIDMASLGAPEVVHVSKIQSYINQDGDLSEQEAMHLLNWCYSYAHAGFKSGGLSITFVSGMTMDDINNFLASVQQ